MPYFRAVSSGSRLTAVSEDQRKKDQQGHMERKRRSDAKNFFVLDTETSGFVRGGGRNEPIQVAAIMYKKGKEAGPPFNEMYRPRGRITRSAKETHGITMSTLKEKSHFTRGGAERLVNFLNREKHYPIVAHYAKYDREDVLKPAMEKVGTKMVSDKRWLCTRDMAGSPESYPTDRPRGLDDLLEYFGQGRRD